MDAIVGNARGDAVRKVDVLPADPGHAVLADHEGGVWALPPVLRNRDKDRDRYLAIGESDRMTLRFVKPR